MKTKYPSRGLRETSSNISKNNSGFLLSTTRVDSGLRRQTSDSLLLYHQQCFAVIQDAHFYLKADVKIGILPCARALKKIEPWSRDKEELMGRNLKSREK